jgi:7-cyano-7-deazaguanine synthase
LDRVAVLASGGLDSAALIGELSRTHDVTPVFIECGLAWEAEEKRALGAFLAALGSASVAAPVFLQLSVASIYGDHWSTTGRDVPDASSEDSAVYLPGRNVLLIGLAAVWCSLNATHKIAIGSLDDNPFADGSPAFFADYARLLSGALSHEIEVIAPFRGLRKWEVIARNRGLPLELSLSCIAPVANRHCGVCNKCFERREAFRKAGVADRTVYAA